MVAGLTTITLDITLHPTIEQAACAMRICKEHGCRMLFTVNEWGLDTEGVIAAYVEQEKIIHVNWCVDDPFYEALLMKKKYRPVPGRIDFVSDRDYLNRMQHEGYRVFFLPLGTDPSVFRPTGDPLARTAAFVGNSYVAQINEFTKNSEQVLEALLPHLAGVIHRYRSDLSLDVEEALLPITKVIAANNNRPQEQLQFIAKHLAGYLFRKSAIKALVNHVQGFELFGDKGWTGVVDEKDIGMIRYGSGLASVYATTAVNIDINRVVIKNGFTQRTFDILATGAFVLTSAKPIVEEFFVTEGNEKEIVSFCSIDELVDLTKYYVTHAKERTVIAERGMRRVLAHHTYQNRIGELFRVLAEVVL